MEWTDKALVLGARRFGETSVILEVMTRAHGRHAGLVHGGRSRRKAPVLQPGNGVEVTWRARLDENLGTFSVEPLVQRAGLLLESEAALLINGTICEHLRLLAERDPHPGLFDAATIVLDALPDVRAGGALMVRFELAFLDELGIGLDLTRCAVSGASGGNAVLTYVSPKTGRAVCEAEGQPYASRLLKLPPFLVDPKAPVGPADVRNGYALTQHFLDRHVYAPAGLRQPFARERLKDLLATVA